MLQGQMFKEQCTICISMGMCVCMIMFSYCGLYTQHSCTCLSMCMYALLMCVCVCVCVCVCGAPVDAGVMQVEGLVGVVAKDEGEDGVLHEIVEGASGV